MQEHKNDLSHGTEAPKCFIFTSILTSTILTITNCFMLSISHRYSLANFYQHDRLRFLILNIVIMLTIILTPVAKIKTTYRESRNIRYR